MPERRRISDNSLRMACWLIVAAAFVLAPAQLDAKTWISGHIVKLQPEGFILRTRFYPQIQVQLSEQTMVRCKKNILKNTDLEMGDLVTVEGLYKDGVIRAKKVTIHRDWEKCREIRGEKPAHCKC